MQLPVKRNSAEKKLRSIVASIGETGKYPTVQECGFADRAEFDEWIKENFDYAIHGHRLWAYIPTTPKRQKKMGLWGFAEFSAGDQICPKYVYGANAPTEKFTDRFWSTRTRKTVSLLDG